MNENKAMYQKFRQTSDAVCLEHGLSIIQNPRGKRVPYNVYKAQQKGIKTKYDHMREDIDSAISHSPDIRYFLADMVSNGYDMSNFYDQNKYATIRHKSDEHGIRLVNLGEQYTPAAIQYRINYRDKNSRWSDYYSNNYRNNNLRERFMVFHFKGAEFYESKYTYEDNFQLNRTLESTMKAITGCVLAGCPVIALLFLALLFAGVLLDEHNQTIHPKSPAMRYSQPRMEFMSKQMELALDKKLYTFQDVEQFIMKTGAELETLKYERSKVYNRLRRSQNPKLIAERDRLTKAITEKRTELNIANRIVKDRPDLEARTEIEKQNMREWYFPVQVSIPTPPKNQNKNKGEIRR